MTIAKTETREPATTKPIKCPECKSTKIETSTTARLRQLTNGSWSAKMTKDDIEFAEGQFVAWCTECTLEFVA